jgi:hypothetical protein
MNRIRPRMRNRRCSNCGHEFALWFHRFSFKHRTAHQIVFLYTVLWLLLVVCVCVDLYTMTVNPDDSVLLGLYHSAIGLFH